MPRNSRRGGAALLLAIAALAVAALPLAAADQGAHGPRLEVLRGEGANCNAASHTCITPAVLVRDAAGHALAGVPVIFSAPSSGASFLFSGDGNSCLVMSNENGVANAAAASPAGANGPVEIKATATVGDQHVTVVIHEMILGLARPAPSANDLDVRLLSVGEPGQGATAAKPRADRKIARLRVEDSAGNPVPGAALDITLRIEKGKGKWEQRDRLRTTTNESGEATAVLMNVPEGGQMELEVLVTRAAQQATRIFHFDL
jgi:hypothetical protein